MTIRGIWTLLSVACAVLCLSVTVAAQKKGGDPKVKLYTGDEQPAKETSPVAVRARRSERTKPTVKSATPTPAEVENAIASDADGHKPVEGDPVAEAHAQPHPDAAREAAAEAKASEE